MSTKFLYDDNVDANNKLTVVECYYHKYINGRQTVQYVKFVNEHVLFATENDREMAERGLYDHGKYPYVFDPLFPIEGSPCGYGFVDLCRNPQTAIDLLNTSFVKNAMCGAIPRYFKRIDGSVNEAEFLDLKNPLVSVTGNMDDDALRPIEFCPLAPVYVSVLDRTIQELRETSGNTETSTGNAGSGVTAASAIAALQEASGKGSKDSNLSAYRAFSDLVEMTIELIRQFYDLPRRFRIAGQYGAEQYISYTNAKLKPQYQGSDFGVDMGYRLPVFDIKISAQKKNVYTKVSQNEMALQFFNMGFFNPQATDQALMCLEIMDFDGKDEIMQQVAKNGTMHQKLVQYMQLALTLAQMARPELVQGLSQDIMQTLGTQQKGSPVQTAQRPQAAEKSTDGSQEHPYVQKARAQAAASSQPDGGEVKERGK